jgi:WD40 repeat protein
MMNHKHKLLRAMFIAICFLLAAHLVTIRGVAAQATPETINAIAWSPDQSRVASGRLDGTVQIRDAVTNQVLHTLTGHTLYVDSLAWSVDGTKLASAGQDGTVRVWDAATGQVLLELIHTDPVFNVIWSSDDSKILSTTELSPNNLHIWNAATGQLLGEDSMSTPVQISRSTDGSEIAIITVAYTLEVRDAYSFAPVSQLKEPRENGNSVEVAWSPKNDIIATGQWLNTIRVWNITTGQIVTTLQANESEFTVPASQSVRSLAFNSNGSRLSSISTDGTVRTWDTNTWGVVENTQVSGPVYAAAFSPDGSMLAYGDADGNTNVTSTDCDTTIQVRNGR